MAKPLPWRIAHITSSNFAKPWKALPWVVGIGFFLRLLVATFTERALHSDEIFQYVEQAHRLTYGYGYIPWEYVHGIRNWLLPGAISLILSSCQLLGIDHPTQYTQVVQAVGCAVSVSLIYFAYWIGRTVFSEPVGRTASVLTAFWYELVIRAHSITPEIVGAYVLMGAVTCLVVKPSYKTALLLGMCGAGTVALRLQYAPAAVVVMAVAVLYGWQKRWAWKYVAAAVAGFLAIALFTGWLDYYTWGRAFASFTNNYLYNKTYGVSSFWEDDSVWYYPLQFGMYSGGIFWIAIASSLFNKQLFSSGPFKKDSLKNVSLNNKPCNDNPLNRSTSWLLLTLLAAVILSHTLIGHKEHRFIFATVPMFLLLTAATVDRFWQPKKVSLKTGKSKGASFRSFLKQQNWGKGLLSFTVFATLAALIVTTLFLEPKTSYLRAYWYLHDQPELTSVLSLNNGWHATGGYYYLHRDVPIYLEYHVEDVDQETWARYISHIMCKHQVDPIPGFSTVAQFGNLDIRVAEQLPTETLDIETQYPPQGGVTGVYTPNVTPRF